MNANILATAFLLGVIVSPAMPQSQSSKSAPIGPKSVFHFKDNYDADLNRCRDDDKACQDAATRKFERSAIGEIKRCYGNDNCASLVMRRFGASEEAIVFARQFGFEGFMTAFVELGKVDMATVYYPGAVNDDRGLFLVNGTPSIIDVAGCGKPDPDMLVTQTVGPDGKEINCLANIDITRHPLYRSLAKTVSDEGSLPLTIWSGHAEFQRAQHSGTGGQRIIITFDLRRCHACRLAGYADIAYAFSSDGHFTRTKLLRLRRP